MDELLQKIAADTGIDQARVRKAVGIIVNFLSHEGPADKVQALVDKLGIRSLADESSGASGGLLGVFNDLTAAGLGMSQIQSVTRAFIAYARTKAGSSDVDAVIGAIPGLGQFI
jgi:hypothetical protein